MDSQNWTQQEFLAFMLFYAASADNYFAPAEKELIIKKVGQDVFNNMKGYFDSTDEFERMEVIASVRDKFLDTEEKKKMILDEMHQIFLSDDEFAQVEQALLTMFEKIL